MGKRVLNQAYEAPLASDVRSRASPWRMLSAMRSGGAGIVAGEARDIAAAPGAHERGAPGLASAARSDSGRRVDWQSVVGICRYSLRRGQGQAREEPSWLSSQESLSTRRARGMSHMTPRCGSTSASRKSLRVAHARGLQRRQQPRVRRTAMTPRGSGAAEPTTARSRHATPLARRSRPGVENLNGRSVRSSDRSGLPGPGCSFAVTWSRHGLRQTPSEPSTAPCLAATAHLGGRWCARRALRPPTGRTQLSSRLRMSSPP